MKSFGAIIILLNITQVLNVSFCSSMFIKSNIKIYTWADIIETNYKTCLSHPALPMEQRNVHLTKKQYSAPKNGHLKLCICIKPVIHFLSFHLRKLISPFESQIPLADMFFFSPLSKSSGCSGNLLTYSLARQPWSLDLNNRLKHQMISWHYYILLETH